jgi:hypothetical protein
MSPPPWSLAQCVLGGKLNMGRFLQYRSGVPLQKCHTNLCMQLLHCQQSLTTTIKDDGAQSFVAKTSYKNKHFGPKQRALPCVWTRLNEKGAKVTIPPQQSLWYTLYANNPLIVTDLTMQAKFRQRFHIPYTSYLKLVEMCELDNRFKRWCGFKKKMIVSDRIACS